MSDGNMRVSYSEGRFYKDEAEPPHIDVSADLRTYRDAERLCLQVMRLAQQLPDPLKKGQP